MVKGDGGYVYFPVLIVMALFLALIGTECNEWLTEKKFTKEMEGKLQTNHLLSLAVSDSGTYLNGDLGVGQDGLLYYENGDVYFRIEEKSDDILRVLLYASGKKGGKAEAAFRYSLQESKMIQWVEK